MELSRIVITGVGLTSPNGNSLSEFRQNLLDGVAGISRIEMRYMGEVLAGVCDFDPLPKEKGSSRGNAGGQYLDLLRSGGR